MSEQYQIDYTISRVADDGRVTEIGFGGTGRWDTIREAAYEVESQLANDEWSHTSPEAAKDPGSPRSTWWTAHSRADVRVVR